MNEWIATQYLDDSWQAIFDNNRGKKIICYGAGTALYTLPGLLPDDSKVNYYIDINYQKWQKEKYEVKHPDVIKQEKKGNFIVLICGQHTISMKNQLEKYGLVENVDFYSVYAQYEKAFRIARADSQTQLMLEFINRLPKDMNTSQSKGPKIGIVLSCTFLAPPAYDIALFLLLRSKGYNVELIVDDLYSIENSSVYEGITKDVKLHINRMIDQVKQKLESVKVKFLSECEEQVLLEKDIKLVKEATHLNGMWQRSRKIERVMELSEEEWEHKFCDILENNLKKIKTFFMENCYDTITIFSGIHGQRYFYTQMCQEKNIRLATYDGAGVQYWSTNGPCSGRYDVSSLLQKNMLSDSEKEILAKLGKLHFEKRQNAITFDQSEASYQTGSREKVTDHWFDVVIPLNLSWDAAAIGKNKVFPTEKEWLLKTIDFILDQTKASVLIREHPFIRGIPMYNTDSYKQLIQDKYGNDSRVHFADYNEELNIYEYINQSKLVLPYTSTTGLEAVLMGKPVVVHTKVFYSCFDFVTDTNSEEEYLCTIQKVLSQNYNQPNDANLQLAYIAYYLSMNCIMYCDFNETNPGWMLQSIEEILNLPEVNKIIDSIVNGIPVCYSNVKEKIEEYEINGMIV